MKNIQIIQGNLLELAENGTWDIIGHGCNTQGIMGAGIALQIARKWPACAIIDKQYHNEAHDPNQLMGTWSAHIEHLTSLEDDPEDKWLTILNLYTQMWPGIPSPGCGIPFDYNAFSLILKKINYQFKGKSIGLPWIGCGLAGADKMIVKAEIGSYLSDMNVTIVEYADNKVSQRSMAEPGLGKDLIPGEGPNLSRTYAVRGAGANGRGKTLPARTNWGTATDPY